MQPLDCAGGRFGLIPRCSTAAPGGTDYMSGEKLGINQPKVSALANYKLDGFSVERLITFLTALDRDVEIAIKNKPQSRTVVAA